MQLPIEFVVPGRPVPFVAAWRQSSWPVRRRLSEYCKTVRLLARSAGWREDFQPTKDTPLYIHTKAVFEDGRHADPENIHKLIVDALMYGGTKNKRDKFTGGAYSVPVYESNARVEVVIDDGRKALQSTIPKDW